MPDAFARGRFGGFQFSGWGRKRLIADRLAWVTPAPVRTLGPERGELAADFWFLGIAQGQLP
jgi:hypothetical protein